MQKKGSISKKKQEYMDKINENQYEPCAILTLIGCENSKLRILDKLV